MVVKTKKFAIDKNYYVKKSFKKHMQQNWKWLLIPLVIGIAGMLVNFTDIYRNWWIVIVAIIGALGYVGFWYIQFYAATQLEQNAQMFDKYSYEIDSRQILMKLNAKEGGIIKWDTVKNAEIDQDGISLYMGKGQFLNFPNKVFNSEHDRKLFENILRRKELIQN